MKELIADLKSCDCETNSPCQYQRKCIEKGKEDMVTYIWLKRVENGASQILRKLNFIEKKGSQRKNKLIEQNMLV